MDTPFDPTKHLRKLSGKDYLEVVYRLQWIRSEHPEAIITTSLQHVDFAAGWAIFHARVEIPGQGVAEGTGSETREGFPSGWLEKAETIAVGRALAMLGYGTAFCLDFDTADTGNGHLADSPVEQRAPGALTNGNGQPAQIPQSRQATAAPKPANSSLATPAQLKLIYMTATRDLHMSEEELEERCQSQYGRLPLHLTKREASEFIDSLRAAGAARAK